MGIEHSYIGIFNDGFPPIMDGVTLTILNYAEKLMKMGEDVCVVTPYNPVKVDVPYEVLRYFSLPIRSRKPYRYGYPKLDPYIWQKLRSTPFKIIHSHSPFAAGRLGVYAKRKQGIPLIGTFHSKYRSDLKHSFKYLPFCVPIIMHRILNFYNACDEVWIPQSNVEDTLREYGYKGKVVTVENGNDFADVPWSKVENIKNKKESLASNKEIRLLFVGQHIWEKGIGLIVEALERLRGKIDFKMTFVGEGYAKEKLKERIKYTGLTEYVKINGLLSDREELRRIYAEADLFLFPSLYDNAPLVVREAAAMGTPSIIPSGSTASEVIRSGFNGFLVVNSSDAYANEILRLSSCKNEIRQVGLNARNTLVRGWKDVIEEVYGRYNELIEKNGKK